jgi:hypothetical protein
MVNRRQITAYSIGSESIDNRSGVPNRVFVTGSFWRKAASRPDEVWKVQSRRSDRPPVTSIYPD